MEKKEWVMPTHIIATAGIVINEKDEVLMVKTHNYDWVFPGGQVEVGENVIDALKREIMEEAGVDIEVGEVFCIAISMAVMWVARSPADLLMTIGD